MRAVDSVVHTGSRTEMPFAIQPARRVDVAVVDDHVLVGRLVVGLLERAGYSAALAFGDTIETTWSLIESLGPQVVLLDFDLGPRLSSIELLTRAVAAEIPVAGFTGSDDRIAHAAFLEAGAQAVIPKGSGPAEVVAMVELALGGVELMAPAERHAALGRLRKHRARRRRALAVFDALTAREAETLQMIAQGFGASEIAEAWQVALPTVRSHIRSVLSKLGVSSQLQAAAMARDSGWYERIRGAGSSILTMPLGMETGTIARRSGSTG